MDGPFYDNITNLFGIDVVLEDFDDQLSAGIYLTIDFTNASEIDIDETLTEASLLSTIKDIGGVMKFDVDEVEVSGFNSTILEEGIVITTTESQTLFTIYFSASAGECSDFEFTMADLIVSFPLIPDWDICQGSVGSGCNLEDVCLEGFTVGGLVEHPVLDCTESENGGIIAILIEFEESNEITAFTEYDYSDEYGDYEATLVGGLDYRITPLHNFNRNCGLTSLDIDKLQDHITCQDFVEEAWQLISGDVNQSGVLSTIDVLEIQKAILELDEVEWPSWTFVPSADYNLMNAPTSCSGHTIIPAYDPFIDIEDVSVNVNDLDFVGIKMGDADGTCTQCSDPLIEEAEVEVRSIPTEINMMQNGFGEFEFSFNENIGGLEVFFFAFSCKEKPEIKFCPWLNQENFVTNYQDGIYYVSYVSFELNGENFKSGQPFLILIGDCSAACTKGKTVQNELIAGNKLSPIKLVNREKEWFKILPNPNQGAFGFVVPSELVDDLVVLEVYTLEGVNIFSKAITTLTTNIELLVPPSIYIYFITTRNGVEAGTLIIK